MTSHELPFVSFLWKVFGGVSRPGSLNVEVQCPWCKEVKGNAYTKRKLSVKVENHLVNCWVCGYKSRNLLHVLRKFYREHLGEYLQMVPLGDHGTREVSVEEDTTVTTTLPSGWLLLAENTGSTDPQVRRALDYLRSRGQRTLDDLWYWKWGVAPDEVPWRVCLPSFDANGKLNWWSARSVFPNPRIPYWNSGGSRTRIVFNEWRIDWSKPLLVGEGPFDQVACGRDTNSTILLGSKLREQHLLFEKVLEHQTPIILGLDPGAVRETLAVAQAFYRLGVNEVRLLTLPPGVKDLGLLSPAVIKNLRSEPYTPFLSGVKMRLGARD